jgi:TP901 family phage tail tape measure protein
VTDRSVTVRLFASVSGYVAGMKTAQTATSGFISSLEKSAAKRKALTDLGNAAGIMGVGFAAAAGATVFFAARFDQSMSKVQAATHESSKNMDLLRTAAIDAGQKTQFSATEAAGAIEALAKAGVDTKDILSGGLKGAMSLAAAGGQDVADAAESAATAMTMFGLSGAQVPHIADLLAAAAGKAQGEVSDLSLALNQTGLVANQTGLSIEETTGALAAFASKGLIGSDAGTSFKNMLQRMNPVSQKAADLVDEYNISAFDQQGNFIGLAKYAQRLHDGLAGLTDQQRQSTMSTIFGSDSVRAATVLYQDGAKGIQSWINKVNDQGYAADTAAIKMDNLAGDLEQLKGSLETAFIGTGEGAQGPLRGLTQDLTKLTNAYISLPAPIKKGGLEVATFLAILGGGAFVATRVAVGLASAGEAMTTLGLRSAATGGLLSGLSMKLVAIRGGAFAAGAGLKIFSDTLDQTHDAEKKLLDITGDVAIGFAVGGPIGAGVGALVGTLAAATSNTYDAAAAQTAFKLALGPVVASLDQQTGAITKKTAASVAQSQADAGVLDIANQLGVSTDLVTKSIMGNTAAQKDFYTALGFSSQAQADQFLAFAKSSEHMDANTRSLVTLLDAVQSGAVDFKTLQTRIEGMFQAQLNSKKTFFGSTAAVESQMTALQGATTAVDRHATALGYDTDALNNWVKAQNKVAAALLQDRHDHYALVAAIDTARKSIADITGGLDAHTKAGQRNEAMVEALVNQWNGSTQSAQNADGAYEATRKTLIAMFVAMGKSVPQAQALTDKLLAVPEVVRVARLETQQAKSLADDLGVKLADIKAPDLEAKLNILQALVDAKRMRDSIITTLGQITDESVNIDLSARAQKVEAQLGGLFASGGEIHGPGTGTSDSILIRASNDEHMWTAEEVRRAGGHQVVKGLRRLAMLGELPKRGDISAFALGGPVTVSPSVSSSGIPQATGAVQSMFEQIAIALGVALSKKLSDLLTHLPTAGMLGPGGTLTPAQLVRGQDAAKSVLGMDYVWGGSDPSYGGFDCSGYQSWILHKARGDSDVSRLGSTASVPWPGSSPGVGRYTMGSSPNVGGTGIGHMAGNIGGLNVESYGGHGPAVGSGARGPLDPMFYMLQHYDRGGILRPGLTLAWNGTGEDEHVMRFAKGGPVDTSGAFSHFGFGDNATASVIKSELHALVQALRAALGKDSPLVDHVKRLGDRLMVAAKAQDRATAVLDKLRQREQELAQSVAATFRHDPFGMGTEGLLTQLRADRNDARKMHQALRKAKKKGLDGGLFAALAASGDLDTAQQLAQMTPAEIHKYEVLWHQRQKATHTLGQFAGHTMFGDQIKKQTHVLNHLDHQIHHLENVISHLGHHVQEGAHKGTRDGAREGAREQGRRAAHGIR